MAISRNLILAAALVWATCSAAQPMPSQRDIDRAAASLPSLQDIDRAAKTRQQSSVDALEEAVRRVKIPQGEVNPKFEVDGNVELNPEKITEMYESFKSRGHGDHKLDQVMLFVSLSMPEESLRRFANQAKLAGVPLVFRGLRYGVGRGNTERGIAMLKPYAKLGARTVIHPVLFRDYDVVQVPTLVVTGGARAGCESSECGAPPVKVTGDASLDYLLEQVAGRPDAYGRAARDALVRMGKAP
jgi:conjugal transfer pilus assembly protein TrbC